jgi:hypothetical protein
MPTIPKIIAILKINILDSPIKGIIYLVDLNGSKAALCHCRGHQSPVFTGSDETQVFQDSKEWFMNNYDGFIQVNKLEGAEESEQISKFKDFIQFF